MLICVLFVCGSAKRRPIVAGRGEIDPGALHGQLQVVSNISSLTITSMP